MTIAFAMDCNAHTLLRISFRDIQRPQLSNTVQATGYVEHTYNTNAREKSKLFVLGNDNINEENLILNENFELSTNIRITTIHSYVASSYNGYSKRKSH